MSETGVDSAGYLLKPGNKDQVVDRFELRGPNRNPGVAFRGAWIGKRSDLVFVLCESDDEALVENVAQKWSEFGGYQIHAVTDVEQY